MRSIVFQNSFVSGEIDPVLYDRSDVQQTGRAARSLSNFRILPQGGITKREGTEYCATVSDTQLAYGVKIVPFVYSRDEAYVIIFTEGLVRVYDTVAKSYVASIINTIWVGPDDFAGFRYRQVLDTMFVTQTWYKPVRVIKLGGYGSNPFASTVSTSVVTVTRKNHNLSSGDLIVFGATASFGGVTVTGGSTYTVTTVVDENKFTITASSTASSTASGGGSSVSSWCISAVKFINIPRVDFSDELSPSATSNMVQRITFIDDWYPMASSNVTTPGAVSPALAGSWFKLSFNGVKSVECYWIEKTNGDPNWDQILYWLNVGLKSILSQADYSIGTTGIDSAGNPYVLIEMTGKYAKKDVSLFIAEVGGKSPKPTIAVETETPAGVALEDVWSTTRGWPKAVEYFEGRLCFAGSTSQPASFWASTTADFGNFDLGDAHDDEAISREVDVNAADSIEHLIGLKSLMAMSRRGEYYQTETPMIPENCTFKQQTSHGSSDIPPCKIGGYVYFVQRNGGAVRRLTYNFQEDAFSADEVTLLARHLFQASTPTGIATVSHQKDGDYAYVSLSNGNMAVLSVEKSQEVAGWWKWNTIQGRVLSMASVNDEIYLVVDRYQTQYEGKICLEKITTGAILDSSKTFTISGSPSTVTASGLQWLDKTNTSLAASGVVARIDFADGGEPLIDTNPAIDSSGNYSKALGSSSTRGANKLTIGYRVSSSFTPLPVPFDIGLGNMMVRRKRVTRMTLDLQSTETNVGGLSVGNYNLTQATVYGEKTTLSKSYLIDGQVSIPILGWSRMPAISDNVQTVLHSYPGSCTIKSMEREVEVTGHLGEEKNG